MSFALALLLGAWLAAAPAAAQEAPGSAGAAQEAPSSAETYNIDFRDAQLQVVIDTIAEISGKSFLYDDRVRGTVTVISPTKVTPEEAYRVFEAILQVKGFTTVPGPGGILKIVPIRTAAESPIETSTPDRAVQNRDLYITRLIPLHFVKADAIASTLRPLISKDANVVTYAPTNTIILTDTSANVRRLLTIIAQIDVATYQEQIKVIPIEYADAQSIADHLREIFGQERSGGGGGRPTARAARGRRATPAAPQQPAVVEGGEVVVGDAGQPRFITDERTNSIIVIAPKTTIRQIEHVITLLDYKRRGSGRIHVYRLQNADAEEMAQTLASLAQGGGGAGGGAPAGGAPSQGAVAELAGGVQVTADAPTNSLIIQASSEGYSAIVEVIQALDVRRPQVMVEALIMEVDINDEKDLGAGFLYQALLGGDDDTRIVIGSDTRPGTAQGGTAFGDLQNQVPDPGTFTSAILGKTVTVIGKDGVPFQLPVIQGILTARASDSDTNIISSPVILTADNEEAQIIVGENIPIPTTQVSTPSGSTAGQFQTQQNIERQDVGVTLRVTPQISEGDIIRLQIFQEISTVDEAVADTGTGPTTRKRSIENTVYVKDGEAVMIGGIIQDAQGESVSKVPFLGDIPILGWAFKSTSARVRKTNLFVILTPRIARTPDDLERMTVEQREQFRDAARRQLELTEKEKLARAAALQAGVPLPYDINPVRRKLELLDQRYPTEELPEMRREQEERERARVESIRPEESEAGGYRVQVAFFRETQPAVNLLADLIEQGYDGTVLSRTEGSEVLHFVQLGPYLSESQAQHVSRAVAALSGRDPVVLVEP